MTWEEEANRLEELIYGWNFEVFFRLFVHECGSVHATS